jgi:hypothetical protein
MTRIAVAMLSMMIGGSARGAYPIIQVVATGMLDVHRTTPRCRAALRRRGSP